MGYLTAEVDGSVTNEIQTLSKSGLTISLSNGGGSVTDSVGEYTAGLGVDITDNVVSVINYDSIAYGSWDRNGADIYFDKGNVGVGTDSPDESFHTTGKVKIEGMVKGNTLDSLVTWNPADSTLRVIPASSIGGGSGIGVVPDPSIPVPIAFQGDTLWVHPTDNAVNVDFATAISTCDGLNSFTKDDWYTPSRIELDAIYKQSYLLTGLEQYNDWKYWSSTEKNVEDAFAQRMDYGGPDPDPKTVATGHRVRCIRKN